MRVMDDVINDYGLAEELEDRMIEETGNTNFYLGQQSGMDEDSEQDDPEAIANNKVHACLKEFNEKSSFVQAVQCTLECRVLATALERAHMQLEDLRGQVSRSFGRFR